MWFHIYDILEKINLSTAVRLVFIPSPAATEGGRAGACLIGQDRTGDSSVTEWGDAVLKALKEKQTNLSRPAAS